MRNKFGEALVNNPNKISARTIKPKTITVNKARSIHDRPSRKDKKHVGGYYSLEVSKQLKKIALDEGSSVQKLLAEGIDMIFHSRKKPMIAKSVG